MMSNPHPVVIIGAGPVGLAAAAHLHRGNEPFLVLEAGASVGAGMLDWAHVRMFSPWEFNIDPTSASLLDEAMVWDRSRREGHHQDGSSTRESEAGQTSPLKRRRRRPFHARGRGRRRASRLAMTGA